MADPPDTGDPDNRAEPRRRVLLSGKVVYGASEMTQDCAVADLSSTGARIRLEGPEPLTDPIYLIVVRQGLAFLAREAWRDGAMVGLRFVRSFTLSNPTPDLPLLVRQIWVEQTRVGGP
jgi:hypothetical protein